MQICSNFVHGPVVSSQYELRFCGAREHRDYTVKVTDLIVISCNVLMLQILLYHCWGCTNVISQQNAIFSCLS